MLIVLLVPVLLVTCGSVLQGPVFGSIALDRPTDAGDAVAFLRCRGGFIHGEIETDAEETRVGNDGSFTFIGSLTFPATERCYIDIRHPRYLTARVNLSDELVQTLDPIPLQSWDAFFAAGPGYELNPGTHRPWPESELHRHLLDSWMWLNTFPTSEQHRMARYIPDIHRIYTGAMAALAGKNVNTKEPMRKIGKLEKMTAYPFPYDEYVAAVDAGDAKQVDIFIKGGVLRQGRGSMLYLAASKGHLAVIDVLLANNEPLNIPGCNAPLLGAISNRQWPAAASLLRAGADIDTGCNKHHRRVGDVLADFARNRQPELLREFLDAGVPANIRTSNNTTPLAEAVSAGRIQAVKILLAAGANPDERTANNTPLLTVAKEKGYLDIERELQLALTGKVDASTPASDAGTAIPLIWRLGEPQPYRVHTSFGHILNLAADPSQPGVLWLATWGGLLRVNPVTGEQRAWTMAEGLPSGTVKNLWFDPGGHYLWLATSGGLARLPLAQQDRVEQIDAEEMQTGFAGGFLAGAPTGQVWYWNSNGLFQVDVENSQAFQYLAPQPVFGATRTDHGTDFFIGDDSTVWRLNTATANLAPVVDSASLSKLTTDGPAGPPQLRLLTLDSRKGYLWIDSFRHGVFRLDLETAAIERPRLTRQQLAECARTTVTPHMHGQVRLAANKTFAQLERCFGRIDDDNRFETLRPRIDAGPVADANGDIWFVADNSFYRIDSTGKQQVFPRQQDALDNAQVKAVELVSGHLRVSAYRSPVAVLDLETHSWSRDAGSSPIPVKPPAGSPRNESADPDAAELTWSINSNGAYLKKNGRVVRHWPAHLPSGFLRVSRVETTTLWIATGTGLIEFPIPGTLTELRAHD